MSQAVITENLHQPFFEYLLHLGDSKLIVGHRLSEWCGHGPFLEEDIALANIALDSIGQANHLLELAGQFDPQERDADGLAYFREETDFRNLLITEQPRGDFAFTIARQFLFDAYGYLLYQKLCQSAHEDLAGIAGKAIKEITYHLRHSREWLLRLGDGTELSHHKIQAAIEELWPFTAEFFLVFDSDQPLVAQNFIPDLRELQQPWTEIVTQTLREATLSVPEEPQAMIQIGRKGQHTEHLGHLLAEMQILARSFPGAKW